MKNHFTIVIPAYNCEQWAVRNLNSALRQNYDNYDIVYVDDCSTDNTLEIVKEVLDKSDKKFKIVSNKENMKALHAQGRENKVRHEAEKGRWRAMKIFSVWQPNANDWVTSIMVCHQTIMTLGERTRRSARHLPQ